MIVNFTWKIDSFFETNKFHLISEVFISFILLWKYPSILDCKKIISKMFFPFHINSVIKFKINNKKNIKRKWFQD